MTSEALTETVRHRLDHAGPVGSAAAYEALDALAVRLRAAETALQHYADPRHWGIVRDESNEPSIIWIGPGSTGLKQSDVPDGPGVARAYLEGQPE